MELVFETNRCVLRRLSKEDHPSVWEAAHTPGFTAGMTWEPPETEQELAKFTDTALVNWEKGTQYVWTIEEKQTARFIGRVDMRLETELGEAVWGLGYFIHPKEQGQGFATEAATAAVDFVFTQLGAATVISSHHDWNVASGRVMQKIGMQHMGQSVGRTFKHGKPVHAEEYAITRDEWLKLRKVARDE